MPDSGRGAVGPDSRPGLDPDSPRAHPAEAPSGAGPDGPDADPPFNRADEPEPIRAQREALEQAGLTPDYVDSIPPEHLRRVQEALDRWNVGGDGNDQGVTRIID